MKTLGLKKTFSVKDIEALIKPSKIRIIGDPQRTFNNVKAINKAEKGDLTFCSGEGEEALKLVNKSNASIILCKEVYPPENKTLIVVENPRLWFIRCINSFFPKNDRTGIHPTVIIGENCRISDDVYIGPWTIIEDDVIIQSKTRIFANVHIFDGTQIGKNVTIQSGSVIGSDGFGYAQNEEGKYERFPHLGIVIIEDDVEIGAHTCIDRGTLSDTVIGKGTKIDNLVHVAHNVEIGKNCIIVCLTCIGGSVRVGDNAWIAPLAVIRDGLTVGKKAIVGMGAVVTKNVDDDDVVAGVPARSIKKKNEDDNITQLR